MTTQSSNSDPMVLEEENENENENNNVQQGSSSSSSKRRRSGTSAADSVPQGDEEYAPKAARKGDDNIENEINHVNNYVNERNDLDEHNDMDNDDHSWTLSPPPFQIDERVFAKDSETTTTTTTIKQPGPETDNTNASIHDDNDNNTQFQYYPAVIQKARHCVQTRSWTYFVHYSGWNARFDQWISQYSILPDNDTTRQRQAVALSHQQAIEQERQKQKKLHQQPQTLANKINQNHNHNTSNTSNTSNYNTMTSPLSVRKRRQNNSNTSSSKQRRTTTPSSSSGYPISKDGGISSSSSSTSKKAYVTGLGACVYEEYCELPFTLKTVLCDEWEKITRTGWDSPITGYDCAGAAQQKPARLVHHLPSTVTVSKVMQHFEKKKLQQLQQQETATATATASSKNATNSTLPTAEATTTATTEPSSTTTAPLSSSSQSELTQTQVRDFCQGMIQLFQDALPVCLLYPQERPQYEALLQNYKQKQESNNNTNEHEKACQTADVYGCEFLLRLYVRLPVLMQAEMTARLNQANNSGGGGGTTATTTSETNSMDTNTNNNNNNNKNETDSAAVAIQLSRDIHYIGPLLSELLVLLQKNRQACFKGSYREAKPEEWLDWEQRLYGGGNGSTAAGKGVTGAETVTAAVPVATTTSSTAEGLAMDTQ